MEDKQKEAFNEANKMQGPISRRKLLATLGAAGAALTAEGLFFGRFGIARGSSEQSVTGAVYGNNNTSFPLMDLDQYKVCVATTLSQLRTGTLINPAFAYYVTDKGREGFFLYDANDTSSADNDGTLIVGLNGRRFLRVYSGDTISASWFGAKGDGVTVETQQLQNALRAAAGRKLFIPKQRSGFYLTGQLYFPSDTVIEFEPGTVVQAIDTLNLKAPYERLIRILDVRNVHVIGNGATLQMNKAVYSTGEQAHIFDISGSENVVIERINANDSGGDGFYVGAYLAVQSYCKNIVLTNCTANNNRRQGLSVITVEGLLVENCRFNNTTGTSPKSGVDIEPNNTTGREVLKRVRFVNCVAEGNIGRGFLVSLQKLTSANDRIDITFEGCRTKGNSFGYSINYGGDGTKGVKGEVRLIDCTAENEQYAGYSVLSCSPDSIKTTYVRCRAVNCNTVNAPEDPYGFGSSFIVTTVPQFPRVAIGNVEYYDCESIDERAVPIIVRGFTAKKNNNEQIRGMKYVNCSVRGGAQSLYSIDAATSEVVISNVSLPLQKVGSSGPVSLSWMGTKITNADASGDILLSLPAAKKGFLFTFFIEKSSMLKITTSAGSAIWTPQGGLPLIQSANPGDSITVIGRADGFWEIVNVIGFWFGTS
ncbi:hypothetical protein GC098_09165 [Paenibacillus sp. LMG 31458]|uniref:Right handed beta helix domain-containing protein n=1 Tax=Paenibacillus phytorum TaxID=2654977 RepID=A0ABX1XTG7_9BACL|nr:right-handed parallel beta-helix repeat-containing protein [Paenibacillus phytorum]NOU71589.1 hypothetical protein [Paenibacillus phytorum]